MDRKEYIDRLFACAGERCPGVESEVCFETGSSFEVSVKNGEIHQYNVADSQGLGFRVLKDGRTGMVRVVAPNIPGAKQALLDTRPLARREGLTLAEVTLHTGRAHQIRVQHAHAGWPLWGDARYGGGRPGQQIALWAAALAFEHPTRHEPVRLAAPPPDAGARQLFRREIEAYMEESCS